MICAADPSIHRVFLLCLYNVYPKWLSSFIMATGDDDAADDEAEDGEELLLI